MKKNLLVALVAVIALAASGVMQAATRTVPAQKRCANGKCGVRR